MVVEIGSNRNVFQSSHFVGDMPFAFDVTMIFDLYFGFLDRFGSAAVFLDIIF